MVLPLGLFEGEFLSRTHHFFLLFAFQLLILFDGHRALFALIFVLLEQILKSALLVVFDALFLQQKLLLSLLEVLTQNLEEVARRLLLFMRQGNSLSFDSIFRAALPDLSHGIHLKRSAYRLMIHKSNFLLALRGKHFSLELLILETVLGVFLLLLKPFLILHQFSPIFWQVRVVLLQVLTEVLLLLSSRT